MKKKVPRWYFLSHGLTSRLFASGQPPPPQLITGQLLRAKKEIAQIAFIRRTKEKQIGFPLSNTWRRWTWLMQISFLKHNVCYAFNDYFAQQLNCSPSPLFFSPLLVGLQAFVPSDGNNLFLVLRYQSVGAVFESYEVEPFCLWDINWLLQFLN